MPLYAYKGIGATGKQVSGVRDADSPKTLRQLMRRDGVVVTQYEVSKGGAAKVRGSGKGLSKEVSLGDLLGRVKKTEVAAFTRQLATLLRAGIPLAESMGALFDQAENVKFKAIIGQVRLEVNEGSSLGDALAKHPAAFDSLFVSMVRAGELAGNLDEVLSRLADFMEASAKLRSKVQGAMLYPIIMLVVIFGILMVLMIAVVPKITDIFIQQGKPLSWNTELLVFVSNLFIDYWWLVILGIAGAIYGFRQWKRSPGGQRVWHEFTLKMPVFGPLVRQVAVSRFSRTLGTMLEAGVPMLRSLDTAKQILGNVILQDAIDDAKQAVTEGESLAVTLRKSKQFPPAMTHMVAVGERAGELEQMLMRVAEAYDSEVDMKLGRMTAIIEPLLIVFMGGVVFFIVVSVLMPIMDLGSLKDIKR